MLGLGSASLAIDDLLMMGVHDAAFRSLAHAYLSDAGRDGLIAMGSDSERSTQVTDPDADRFLT